MNNSEYTPGPWHVAPMSPTWVGTKYSEHIASTDTFDTEDEDEQKANARLIAAAPELLEALIAITNQLERIGDTREHKDGAFIRDARAAIAKATGSAV